MSYANAEPKPLKFLVSDGDLVDENGNVIAHSDSLKDMYDKACPEVKKYLLSDGSVVDEDNNLIIKNDYFKKVYDQAVPKVAKYLHSDGTIDENPSGGGSDLENNHQATIDVSTYTQPVEVTPTSGKDGMKKVTITLDNIPSGNVLNFFTDTIPGFLLKDDPESEVTYPYYGVYADGTYVPSLAELANAQFFVPAYHGGNADVAYRRGSTATIPHNDIFGYADDNDFTVTDGKITLKNYPGDSGTEYLIETATLYLNNCMASSGS